MKCNCCDTEMEDLYYDPDGYGWETLRCKGLGPMKFCPKCGNVQVDISK